MTQTCFTPQENRLKRHHRQIVKRIIVYGKLILETPTCLGSGDAESPTDMPVLRDSVSDHALLTGASLAGALRNYLWEYKMGMVSSYINQLKSCLMCYLEVCEVMMMAIRVR
jgi:CRISPR/Cas system CSM-associated protein Csm3 (group 7 of RAMP superfamily)